MNTITHSMAGLVVSLGLMFAGAAAADSPVDTNTPDKHSVEVKGKVNLYRVQIKGMDLGKGKDKAHAEVFVSVDSTPGMIYTLALSGNSGTSIVNQEMAKTLRAAYVSKSPVTLYRQIAMGKNNNFKILMVQLD